MSICSLCFRLHRLGSPHVVIKIVPSFPWASILPCRQAQWIEADSPVESQHKFGSGLTWVTCPPQNQSWGRGMEYAHCPGLIYLSLLLGRRLLPLELCGVTVEKKWFPKRKPRGRYQKVGDGQRSDANNSWPLNTPPNRLAVSTQDFL